MTPEEEIAKLKQWNATLVKKHDEIVKKARSLEYSARDVGFTWGMGTLLIIMLTTLWIDKTYDLETLSEDNKLLMGMATAATVAFYRGMNWLGVGRHNPERGKKK